MKLPSHLVPLEPKCPPNHPVLKHPRLMPRRQYKTLRTAVSIIRNIDRVQHDNNKTDTPAVPPHIHIQGRKQQKDNHETSQYTAHSTAQIDEIPHIHAECVTSRQSAILKDLCDFCHCYLLNPLKPSGHFADHQARGCSTNTEPVR